MTKRVALVLLWLVFCFFPLAAEVGSSSDDSVRLSKIRLSIDDRDYVWSDAGLAEEKPDLASAQENPPRSCPRQSFHFLGMRPGDNVLLDALPVKCREVELRLMESGLVYAVSVVVAPARKDPSARTLVVTVTSGFLWRFGGGNAYGVAGKDALGGRRDSLRIFAGWNRNGARYMNYCVGGLPLALGGSLTWFGPGESRGVSGTTGTVIEGSPMEAVATVGILPHPDFMVGVDTAYEMHDFSRDSANLVSIQPFVRYRRYLVSRRDPEADTVNDAGVDSRAFIFPSLGAVKGELSGFAHCRFTPWTSLAIKCAGGLSSGSTAFDLLLAEDRSIRSGYTEDELSASSFAFASAELRQRFLAFRIPPGLDCSVQLFAFSDVAVLNCAAISAVSSGSAFADAYGVGARVLFDNPVFAYFTFSYGLNHEGSARFMFSGTAGF